ncbi:MAG: YhcH/YjgK/YiaL family protein [Acidaminococcaceae bacterium]|nr:YhcH/YjgK/YiaL family protein [Acidaminococcaceae bacterium]
MISTSIDKIEYILPYVSGKLATALQYIKENDFAMWANGKYEIDGRNIFARINTYETEPKAQRKPEKHFDYIDIQILVIGSESVGYCPVTDKFIVSEDKAKTDDVVFYKETYKENFITLHPGDIGIFFPWEVHRPNCNCGDIALPVKKVVVKVRADK